MRLLAAVLIVSSPALSAAELIVPREPVPDRYIVVLQPKVSTGIGTLDVLTRELVRRVSGTLLHSYTAVLGGFAVEARGDAIRALLADPRISYVEQDSVMRRSGEQKGAIWGLDRLDQGDLPLDGRYRYDGDGAGVTAYIVDTGVRASHQDFAGRMEPGYNTARDRSSRTDASDCDGHGTHVAGTVAGATHGVAKAARIVGVRVLGCDGSGTSVDVIAGLDWVAKNARKPAVVNMSLGGGGSPSMDNAVKELHRRGIVVVAAAGNENKDACERSPARAPEAITVAASDRNDKRASFSNKGSCVDLFAPGHQIASAGHTADDAVKSMSGTSMATPHVAGAVALFLAARPKATPAEVERALLDGAAREKIADVAGSPNRLLQVAGLAVPPAASQPPPPGGQQQGGAPKEGAGAKPAPAQPPPETPKEQPREPPREQPREQPKEPPREQPKAQPGDPPKDKKKRGNLCDGVPVLRALCGSDDDEEDEASD